MDELKNALTFPVFYHGLVARRTLLTQYDAVNLIFKGRLTGQCLSDEVARPLASSITHEKKKVAYSLARPVLDLSLDELARRLKELHLQNVDRVAAAFYAYSLTQLSLSAETVCRLKSAYTESDNTKDAYIYIAQALLCALEYSNQECPLSRETERMLESLGSQRDTGLFSAQDTIGPLGAELLGRTGGNPLPEPALPAIVEAIVPQLVQTLLSTIYLHEQTEVREFERIKASQMGQAAAELLRTGKMTYSEYYKCGNFLEIAKKADLELQRRPYRKDDSRQFDFDWFLRFFEAAGSISSADMQVLWAKVLAGEIESPGHFPCGQLRLSEI